MQTQKQQTLINIARLMVKATNEVLYKQQSPWLQAKYPKVKLLTQVGSGEATHCTKYSDEDFAITYGIDMVASKIESQNCGASWLSHKEIVANNYFGGVTSIQNLLAQTVLHEYAHFLQFLSNGVKKGSVHNQHFYYLLNKLFKSGIALDVKRYMLQYKPFQQLSYSHENLGVYKLADFATNDLVELFPPNGHLGKGIVIKAKRTRVEVAFKTGTYHVYPSQVCNIFKKKFK